MTDMVFIRYTDGKGGKYGERTSDIIPRQGDYVRFPTGQQLLVTRVIIVYRGVTCDFIEAIAREVGDAQS